MCAREPRLDPVGVALAQRLRPRAVAGVELAGGVALHVPRQLLQLDPEDPLALGRAARVHRQRLPADDRRLGRQQAALGLVDRARDAVEAGRDVHDRRPREPLVALPARRLGEREVDLHLGAAVAEPPPGRGDGVVRVAEQRAVELGRGDVRDHGPRRLDGLAVGGADAGRPRRPRTSTESTSRPCGTRRRCPRSACTSASARRAPPPLRHRHPALLDGDRDHLRHEARTTRCRGRARCAAPTGRAGRGPAPRRTCSLSQSRLEIEHVAARTRPPVPAEPAHRLRRRAPRPSRPELGAEQAEREVGVRHEARRSRGARPLRRPARGGRTRPRSRRSSGAGRRPRRRGNAVAVGQSVFRYSRPRAASSSPSMRVRGAADPERMPGREARRAGSPAR